jgi:hypothetical protein
MFQVIVINPFNVTYVTLVFNFVIKYITANTHTFRCQGTYNDIEIDVEDLHDDPHNDQRQFIGVKVHLPRQVNENVEGLYGDHRKLTGHGNYIEEAINIFDDFRGVIESALDYGDFLDYFVQIRGVQGVLQKLIDLFVFVV